MIQMVFHAFSNSLKRKIYFYKISSNILIALENPFIASLLCGEVNILLCSLYSYLLIKNKDIMINKNVKIGYRHNKILLNLWENIKHILQKIKFYIWAYNIKYKFILQYFCLHCEFMLDLKILYVSICPIERLLENLRSGCGGTGRRARLRIWFREEWGFKSLHPHHLLAKDG